MYTLVFNEAKYRKQLRIYISVINETIVRIGQKIEMLLSS